MYSTCGYGSTTNGLAVAIFLGKWMFSLVDRVIVTARRRRTKASTKPMAEEGILFGWGKFGGMGEGWY